MERDILDDLLRWKSDPDHKPAMIRGVRQCGKTWAMKELGRHYSDCAYFNFEEQRIGDLFEQDYSVDRIVRLLGALRGRPIGTDCLIILDEIQMCPRAITALKYFCEDGRYDVICAGSLLGAKLMTTSPPVGKVDDFTMYPMSFREFLIANGQRMVVDTMEDDPSPSVVGVFADRLIPLYREYLAVGGLPEAVGSWVGRHDPSAVDSILRSLADRYVLDMVRYGDSKVKSNGELVWRSIPSQLAKDNNRFFMGHVSEGVRARDLWSSVDWLDMAGLVHTVPITVGSGSVPSVQSDPSAFKLYCFDTGVMRVLADIPFSDALIDSDRSSLYRGAIAENYILCELRRMTAHRIWCWRSGNRAEVDFLTRFDGGPVPIGVKAGEKVRANSLKVYLNSHDGTGVVASMNPLSIKDRVIMVPLYAFWLLPTIMEHQRGRS